MTNEERSKKLDVLIEKWFTSSDMDRRDFLRLVSSGALSVAAGLVLGGCGGGGSSSDASGSSSITQGTSMPMAVNTTQIGGSDLAVQSAFQPNVPVGPGNTCTVAVSPNGVQLLHCSDSAGALRGLGISNAIHATHYRQLHVKAHMAPPFLIFDATSTAIALVFITMGILTTDPQEAAERVSQIEQLPSFSPLAAFLATNLPRATLQELRPNSSLDGLIQTCAQDWFAAYAPSVAPRTHSDVQPRTVVTDHKNQFTAFLVDASRRDALFFTLQNASWRFVHVDLQAVDASGKELAVQQPLVTAMKGGEPYNWGSLFTGTVGNPTQHDLTVDASQLPTAAAIRFWVRGPGLHAEANDGDVWVYDLPPSITASDKEAWTMSILYYAAAPFIDLVLGSLDVFKKLFGDKRGSLTDAIWDHIKDKADPSNWISLETNGTLDFKDSMKAAVDLEFTILGLAALIITVLGIETELAAAVAATAILIARASLSLDAANLRFLAQNMWWVGHIGKYELPL